MVHKPYPSAGSRSAQARAHREAHWREVVRQWRTSGLSKAAFARREGICRQLMSWWDAELRRREDVRGKAMAGPGRPSFVPVRVVEPTAGLTALELVAGGRVVRVRPGFDPQTLQRLVEALEGGAC